MFAASGGTYRIRAWSSASVVQGDFDPSSVLTTGAPQSAAKRIACFIWLQTTYLYTNANKNDMKTLYVLGVISQKKKNTALHRPNTTTARNSNYTDMVLHCSYNNGYRLLPAGIGQTLDRRTTNNHQGLRMARNIILSASISSRAISSQKSPWVV